jgi:hypothetical protein
MPWTIEERFKTAANAEVTAFILARPTLSAHDEVADVLTKAAKPLRDVGVYCPNFAAYAYVLLHTRDATIFGLAYGQRGLAFKLTGEDAAAARAAGAQPCPEIGPSWLVFDPWAGGTPVDAAVWCKRAHDAAHSMPHGK